MLILLLFALTLTNKQQAQHDLNEWQMSQRIQADDAVIADMWRPPAKLIADYRKARRCYAQFHLYRIGSCDTELKKVETDLGNIEVARTEDQ